MTEDDSAARPTRWPVLLPLAVLLILCALLIPVLQRPPSAAARARFDQIQDGMTEDQVEGLLGSRGPHDKDRFNITMTSGVMTGPGSAHLSWWYFPGCDIEVGFDKDARVCSKKFMPLPPQSLFDRAVMRCRQALHSHGP